MTVGTKKLAKIDCLIEETDRFLDKLKPFVLQTQAVANGGQPKLKVVK